MEQEKLILIALAQEMLESKSTDIDAINAMHRLLVDDLAPTDPFLFEWRYTLGVRGIRPRVSLTAELNPVQ